MRAGATGDWTFCLALHFDDAADGERVFDALAQQGMVQMPFQDAGQVTG